MTFMGGVPLPQVRPSLVPFLVAAAPNGKKAGKLLSTMHTQKEALKALGAKCKDTIESDFIGSRSRSSISFGELTDPLPHVLWAREKYGRLSQKYKKIRCDKYVAKIEQICEIVGFLEATIKWKLPFIFHESQFMDHLMLTGDAELEAIERRLLRLKAFITANSARRHPPVKETELIQCLRKTAADADAELEYVRMNEFDALFHEYLISTGKIDTFESIASGFPSPGQGSIDFTCVEQLIRATVMDLGLNRQLNKFEYYVLRCATIRIIFDIYYGLDKAAGLRALSSQEFVEKSVAYLALTPREHGMNATIIHESLYDETLHAITRGTGFYEKAVARMTTAFLYTSPLDIAFAIHKVLNCVVKAVNVFAYVKPKRVGDDLGFDDFFSFYVPVCAMTPYINHEALRDFVAHFNPMKLSSTLDYSRVTMIASVDAICDFSLDACNKQSLQTI